MTLHEHRQWTDQLSDYLDGELSDQEQRAVAAHLAECPECSATLEQLRAVMNRAQHLEPLLPPADLWKGVSERIASPEGVRPVVGRFGAHRRLSFTWPELIAASILLVVISGWAALRLTSSTSAPATAHVEIPNQPVVSGRQPDVVTASFEDKEYDAAVVDLERALQSGRGQLDPATVKIVEDNLAIIDQAVDDARRALAADPANADLSGYLVETRRRKLDVLRSAAALTELNN
jgi:putative zinc finger protein